LQDIKKRVKNI